MDTEAVISVAADDLDAPRDAIKKAIEAQGFAVLQPWDSEPDTLRRVGSLFGTIQSHIRANEQGVVGVGGPQREDAEWHRFRSEYHGLGTGYVAPHSDGTFVDGLWVKGDSMVRVGPPRYVVLHLVRHADEGGANIAVDGQRVLQTMLREEPDLAAVLMTSGCVTFCRDDQLALEHAVFRPVGGNHLKYRFRGDSKAYSPSWARDAVQRLKDHYHESSEFRTHVELQPDQMLVLDNTRVLHGREQFTNEDDGRVSGRKLHRIWILDEQGSDLTNLEDQMPTSRALNAYDAYGPVDNDLAVDEVLEIETGVRLDPESMAIASDLLRPEPGTLVRPIR